MADATTHEPASPEPASPALASGTRALARSYLRQYPEEATRRLERFDIGEIVRVVTSEPLPHAVPVVERLSPNVAADVLRRLPDGTAAELLSRVDPVRAVAILGWMDEEDRAAAIAALPGSLSRELRIMSEYPPETAGRLMDPRVLGFPRGTTVHEALAALRQVRRPVSDVFLVGEEARLLGSIPLQALAVALPDETLDHLARPPVAVDAMAPQDEVVDKLTERRLSSMPVVDFDGRLLGVIRHDTLVATAQEDVAADIQAMVGASRQERALSPPTFAIRKRLPWLQINLATAFLAASVVGLFEETIAQVTVLAVLQGVVAGQSGNTGAQALAVTMRGLAVREIRLGQWPRVLRKEASVAFINGIAVALVTALGVFLWSQSPGLAFVIGVSMVISMLSAGMAGVLVPIALTSFGQDPAQSSSIILTTVTDVVGFGSFLGIATLLIGILPVT